MPLLYLESLFRLPLFGRPSEPFDDIGEGLDRVEEELLPDEFGHPVSEAVVLDPLDEFHRLLEEGHVVHLGLEPVAHQLPSDVGKQGVLLQDLRDQGEQFRQLFGVGHCRVELVYG